MTNKNLEQDHCSSICNALMMMITGVIETFTIVICIVVFGRDIHYEIQYLQSKIGDIPRLSPPTGSAHGSSD